jgi:ABC-type multidrug transport system fused ATPase/permease subunit
MPPPSNVAPGSGPVRTRRPLRQILARFLEHVKPHRKLWLIGLLLGVCDAACQTAIPMFFRSIINALQLDPDRFWSAGLVPALAFAGGLAAVFFPVVYFFHIFVFVAGVRTLRDLRTSLYVHVQCLSANFFLRTKVGEVSQRITADISGGVHNILMQSAGLIWVASTSAMAVAMMLWVSPPLFLVFLAFAIISWLLSRRFLPRLRDKSREVRDADGRISALITEYVGAADLIRAFSREREIDRRVIDECSGLTRKSESLLWYQHAYLDTVQLLARVVAPLTMLFVGGLMVTGGQLLIGDLVAFWGYWLMVGGNIQALANMASNTFAGMAAMDRVFDFFDETPLVGDRPGAQPAGRLRGEVEFRDVTFAYPVEGREPVLDRVSFTIPAGRFVALVGPSGAGKSTVLQLLLRFYDPTAGAVLVDGRDIRDLQQKTLRAQIGFVMQESVLLSGSIADNLRLGAPEATAGEIRRALADANALEFVEELPDGIDSLIGERGARLSGGQRQRLAIARAFLKNPPVMIFDEATSSLDSASEREIQCAMQRLLAGRTTIMVAHRISTIVRADEIMVLDDRRIQARGTHEELLRTNKLYARLCGLQGVAPAAGAVQPA